MRSLNPDEAELWARVTASIRPLSREPLSNPDPASSELPRPLPPPMSLRAKGPGPRRPEPAKPAIRPGTTLDGSWDRKLSKGAVQPDATLDLHGHDLDAAWLAIDDALERAVRAGHRVLLLITGHARTGEPPIRRGRIRAAVHDWLAVSRHAGRIAAVRGAHQRHGGGGSLYIIFRRS